MFDPLANKKQAVRNKYCDYQAVTSFKHASIELAVQRTEQLMSSPKGLAASFALGSCYAGDSSKSATQHISLLKLVSQLLV